VPYKISKTYYKEIKMSLYKHYVEVEGLGEVKFSISFNRDRTNWATSQPKKVGYNVTVIPVKRTHGEGRGYTIEESVAFTGFNMCLLEAERQSKNRLAKAIQIMHERSEVLIGYLKTM
jgi:hypothetical protein